MPLLSNWLLIEVLTYYAQIIASVTFLFLSYTYKTSNGAWIDYYFKPNPEDDFMDGYYLVFQWFSMIFSLIFIGFFIEKTERGIVCDGSSYFPNLYVLLSWALTFLIIFTQTLFNNINGIWLNKNWFALSFIGITGIFYIYFPIHFFVISGCQ